MFSALSSTFSALNLTGKNPATESDHATPTTSVSLNTRENLKVEVITLKDYKKAARTLQIAFEEDLYVNYLTSGINEPHLKQQMNLALFEATAYSTILSGVLVGVRDLDAELTDPNAPFLAVACFWKPEKKSKLKSKSKSTSIYYNKKKANRSGSISSVGEHQFNRNNPEDTQLVQNSDSANNGSLFSYLWSMYQGGYLKFVWLANKETRQRVFNEQWKLLDNYRAETLGDDFHYSWYLSDIGAIPRGRGKGLARMLVDHVCQKYVDVYKQPKEEDDYDDVDDDDDEEHGVKRSSASNPSSASDEESKLDSEIESFNFQFPLDSDNLTDYSGYSSLSDNESAHSSWYYNEEEDILSKYDQQQRSKNVSKSGRPRYGAPLYLESSHPRNRKIYQKLGFTYVKTVPVADVQSPSVGKKTLTMDLMVRGVKGAKYKHESMFS